MIGEQTHTYAALAASVTDIQYYCDKYVKEATHIYGTSASIAQCKCP